MGEQGIILEKDSHIPFIGRNGIHHSAVNDHLSGKGVGKDISKTIELYTFAAEHNIVPAAVSLAQIYSEDQYGCLDYSKAAKWYQVGASNGNVPSMRELGIMYLEGRGIGTDISKGIELLKKAAENNDTIACWKLSTVYEEGKLVYKDQYQSNKYLEKLANNGDALSAYKLALKLDIAAKTDADNLNAMRWYAVASDAGIPYATKTLAIYYLKGVGGRRDLKSASKYYIRSKHTKIDPRYSEADRDFDSKEVELLELATDLCRMREKYPGCRFFVRHSRLYQETKTERVKIGENVEKMYIDGVYAYDVSRTPVYEDREWTETYEGTADTSHDFDELIDAAMIMSERYSSDGYAVIGFNHEGNDYRVATFRDGRLL